MSSSRHLASVPSGETWLPWAEGLYEEGEISPNEARLISGLPVPEHQPDEQGRLPGHVSSIGTKAADGGASLELVTEDHVPQPHAKRAPKLRAPRPARTAREKAARDMGERLKHITPPEWQTAPLSVVGAAANSPKKAPGN